MASSDKQINEAEMEVAARQLPGGLQDRVTAHMMARERRQPDLTPEGRSMAASLKLASEGIPDSPERYERWKRLGLID